MQPSFSCWPAGFPLIFGVMHIVNIAHGSYYMLGAYIGLSIYWVTGSFALAILGGGFSHCRHRITACSVSFCARFFYPFPQVMMTMGFAYIFRDLALLIWGGDPLSFPAPEMLQGSIHLGEIVFPLYRIFIILIAICCCHRFVVLQ